MKDISENNGRLERAVSFLTQLGENNDRDWLLANKGFQKEAQNEFADFVRALYEGLLLFDPTLEGQDPVKSIFRIYRDVRFSKDKRPYKTNFGVFIKKGGKKTPYSGYYFHLEPGASFVGGGLYMPASDILQKVRQEIDYHPEEVRKLLQGNFPDYFGEMKGDKLKRPPRGYSQDHPLIDLLKHKSFLMMHTLTDTDIGEARLAEVVLDYFRAMTPWNTFLNRAID